MKDCETTSPTQAVREFAEKFGLDEAAQVDLELLLKKAEPKFRLELAKGVK